MSAVMILTAASISGCAKKSVSAAGNTDVTTRPTAAQVKAEGKLVSYGMPDNWANYSEIFSSYMQQYGITHQDTDMSSAEELGKFTAEKNNPVADLGDVGITFGPGAVASKILQPYKNKYWNDVPSWAKDKNGYWTAAYTGSISFLVNKSLVKDVPHSWKDLLKPEYKGMVVLGDMTTAAQSQNALLAASFANGGSEKNITPGINYFKQLNSLGNIKNVDNSVANLQKGEIPIGIFWDFNSLGYRKTINGESTYDVVIPTDGTVMSAYISVINAYAPHPEAAKAFQDYLFSDAGQVQLAKGFARPIRSNVTLPNDVKSLLLPDSDYKSAKQITDYTAWGATCEEIPDLWRNNILAQ